MCTVTRVAAQNAASTLRFQVPKTSYKFSSPQESICDFALPLLVGGCDSIVTTAVNDV